MSTRFRRLLSRGFRPARRSPRPTLEPLEQRALLSATLVKDINTAHTAASMLGGSYPGSLNAVNLNGTLYFSAYDPGHGQELWKSDGTAAGTTLVADIVPGPGGSSPQSLTVFGGKLFFTADDGAHGRQVWKSDGTAAGTTMVSDIPSSPYISEPDGLPGTVAAAPAQLTPVNGTLFFTAEDAHFNLDLWKTDGTPAGTVLVKSTDARNLTAVNGTLFYTTWASPNGEELWKSDGTPAGTVLVQNINPGPGLFYTSNLTAVNGTLFFVIGQYPLAPQLWRSDGTAAGTMKVTDISPGLPGSIGQGLVNVNGTLLFAVTDAAHGLELWKSNGTAAGTVMLKEIDPGANWSSADAEADLTVVNGTLFFKANDGIHGNELWKSDGTAAGTAMVTDIDPGAAGSVPDLLTNINGTLLFSATDGVHGVELWKSDGTAAGTGMVADINPGPAGSVPFVLAGVNGTLFFAANDGSSGTQLWKSDGTAGGTVKVKDIDTTADASNPSGFVPVGGTLYFSADDGVHGPELWKTDGSAAGTTLVKDINPGPRGSGITGAVALNGVLYFSAGDSAHGQELWKSDGTAAGTVMVKDINPGAGSSPQDLTVVNNTLFFTADDGVHGRELWKTDGTAAGTGMVADLNPGSGGTLFFHFLAVNGTLDFVANDGVHTYVSLWKTDGTAAGTVLLKSVAPDSMAVLNGALYFLFSTGLWKSDGTAAGTVLVKEINPEPGSFFPGNLTVINGTFFFAADDGIHGVELWKSDGTAAGTTLVADLNPGSSLPPWEDAQDAMLFGDSPTPNSSSPADFTAVNGTILFSATGPDGRELWQTDGTGAGTALVKDIAPGTYPFVNIHNEVTWLPNDSNPQDLTAVNGTVYFTADDGAHGRELWESNGTAGGTFLVADLNPTAGSNPGPLVNVNGTLFFTASDGAHGPGLWKYTPDPVRATGLTVTPVAGQSFAGTVATFTDPTAAPLSAYSARITWGDGQTSAGTISAQPGGGFAVSGGHTYARAGQYPVGVVITRSDGVRASVTGTAQVADAPLVHVYRQFVRTVEGRAFAATVATFQSANPAAAAADFSAVITWGDGHTSTATVKADGKGGFVVTGSHTYAEDGSYPVGVQIRSAGGSTATVASQCRVDDAPLTAVNVPALAATAGVLVRSATVAAFTDADPNGRTGYYTATIDWGDGSTSAGAVAARTGGGFLVQGSHTYTAAGRFRVSTTVRDRDGSLVKTFIWATVAVPKAA